MGGTLVYLAFALILAVSAARHIRRTRKKESAARAAAARNQLGTSGPRAQHPRIDTNHCIGCGACVDVCPEGDVLAVIGGKAAIVNGHKCIGHGLCAEACPVGAITIVMANPSVGADLPRLTPERETTVPNLFIAGELGGLALIKNAVNEGRDCVDAIAARIGRLRRGRSDADVFDVCIVGAGPAGISASLRAIERGLRYCTLEQDEFGGTVAKFPRQKLVLTSPVEFPIHGKFTKLQISKEELLRFWGELVAEADLHIRTSEPVETISRGPDGVFEVRTPQQAYRAWTVLLALGRRGTPRKLGVPGEHLPKVMYSLLETEAYAGARVLVVGGGDSAVEAALGLARQKGTRVTLSYRKAEFTRIKERNAAHLRDPAHRRALDVLLNSQPVEIKARSVVLDVSGERREIPNDYVFVFAGGTPPNDFLARAGVHLGPQDLTAELAAERGRPGADVSPGKARTA